MGNIVRAKVSIDAENMLNSQNEKPISKSEMVFDKFMIEYEERPETEEEIQRRKEEAEKIAALDPKKKKAPAKQAHAE